MTPVSGIGNQAATLHALGGAADAGPSEAELEVREQFQQFVAGTFYKQMLKSLRRMHDRPAFLDGGQAEQIFQSQLDQHVAENLARDHGGAIAEPLFESFVQ